MAQAAVVEPVCSSEDSEESSDSSPDVNSENFSSQMPTISSKWARETQSARKMYYKFDVTIRSAAVKSQTYLETVCSSGGGKYHDFRVRKLHVSSVLFKTI